MRKQVKLIIEGSVFALAVLSTGCSNMLSTLGLKSEEPPVAKRTYTDPGEPATRPASEPQVVAAEPLVVEPAPPVVNVFGEFDGVERPFVKEAGDIGIQQHTWSDEGFDADVAVDPTGKWLVFASTRHAQHSRLYLQKTDGQAVIELTSGDFDDVHPAFSPDGRRIAFASTRAGRWALYTCDVDGKNVVQITNGASQDMHPSFSPDGSRLVYCSLSPRSAQWELWTINLDTNERRMIGTGLFPVWSPDKSVDRIAFQRARQRGSRWFSLWTVDLVDGEPRRLMEVAASPVAAVISPTWSPDGKKLAFATVVEPTNVKDKRPAGRQDIWVINSDGTGRHRLTTQSHANFAPYWAVNNRVYFVSDRGGRENVWSIRADSGSTLTAGRKDPTVIGATDGKDIGN